MVVAMSCTDNWYHYLMVDLYSLLETNKDIKKVYLLVSTDNPDDIPYLNDIIKTYDKVDIVLKNVELFLNNKLDKNNPNRDTRFSSFCFTKLLLSNFVEEDKVLYIDTDAIVKKDISNLWKYDISEYYAAGVRDIGIEVRGNLEEFNYHGNYINSGVVLFNLKKIREDDIEKKWFEFINQNELYYPDQDALNIVCNGKVKLIPSMYNVCFDVTQSVGNYDLAKIFHFAGRKTDWIMDFYCCEEWYDAEENFYNKFGWYKDKE